MRRRVATPDELERAVRRFGPERARVELRRHGLIPPIAGATGLAIDASTPALATGRTVSSLTSNSFSPPANSLLVVVAGTAYTGGTVSSLTDSLGTHLTYTNMVAHEHSTLCDAEIWVADVPGTAPGSMTVTATMSTSGDPALGVIVFTGAQNAAAQIANGNFTTADDINPPSITTPNAVAAGSQVVMVLGNWSSNTTPTPAAGQTITINGHVYHYNDSTPGNGWWAQVLTANSAGGSTVTMSDSAPSGSTVAIVVGEILAATGSPPAAPTPRMLNWPQAMWRSAYR